MRTVPIIRRVTLSLVVLALLFGGAGYSIERCNPGQAIYLAGDFCSLRYEMDVSIAHRRLQYRA